MASRYWVGGSGTWATNTANWSATSGGAAGASYPGSGDDVYFDANSGGGAVAIGVTATINSLNCTGFTGSWSSNGSLSVKTNATFGSGMTSTWGGTLYFVGTTGTPTLTTNGVTMPNIEVDGSAGLAFADSVTMVADSTITHTNGFLEFPAGTVSGGASFASTGSNTRSIYLVGTLTFAHSSTFGTNWTISGSNCTLGLSGTTGLGSEIILSGANATFTGGGMTYETVSLTGSGKATVKGANSFVGLARYGTATKTDSILFDAAQEIYSTVDVTGLISLVGNSVTNRLFVGSTVTGAQRDFYLWNGGAGLPDAEFYILNADFRDFDGSGSATSPWDVSVDSTGDCGNNGGITFTSAESLYWVGGSGNFSDTNHWAATSGGAGGLNRVPLPQDPIYFDANSFSAASQTVTFDMPRVGSADWTGVTHSPGLTMGMNISSFGSWNLNKVYITGGSYTWTMGGAGTNQLTGGATTSGYQWPIYFIIDTSPGTVQLQDNCRAGALNVYSGTFDANNMNVLAANGLVLSGSSLNTCTVLMGSGTWTVDSGGFSAYASTLTLTPSTSTLIINGGFTVYGGSGVSLYNVEFSGTNNVTGSNTFNTLTLEPAARIAFKSGTTQTVTSLSATGTSGNVISIYASTSGSAATLSCASGTINCDYLSLTDSAATGGATFHAGSHSTNVSGNSGWIFP